MSRSPRWCGRALGAAWPLVLSAALLAQEDAAGPADDLPALPPQTVVGQVGGEGPTVVTPTTQATPAARVGTTTRVVTGEELQRAGYVNAAEALRGVAGVDVVQQGQPGGLTSVFLRGGASQHTKVLLDGLPINDPSGASRAFDFSTLSVDNIERIEIAFGPQSLLYGSDALAGVIQIITRRGAGPLTAQFGAMGGAFGTHRESLNVSGSAGAVSYAVGGSWFETSGFSAARRDLGNPESDGFSQGTVFGRFGFTPTETIDFDVQLRWIDADADIDDAPFSLGSPPVDDPFRKNLTEQFFTRVEARVQTLDGAIEHVVAFSLADILRSDTDDLFPTEFRGQTRRFEWRAHTLITENHSLLVGADYTAEDATSDGAFGFAGATQYDPGVFLMDELVLWDRWTTTAGVRWDDHSAAGPASTYRLASVYNVLETGSRVRGSLGTGFRAPSLAENLFPFGNPDLSPERSRGWDFGVEQSLADGAIEVGATYFRTDYTDLILFDLNTFTLENIGAARTHGVELTALWRLAPLWEVTGNYTHTDTRDGDTGQRLVRRPQDKGNVVLTRYLADGRGAVSLYGVFVGDRTDTRDGSVVLAPYNLFHLAGYYHVSPRCRVHARIHNLFDEDYEEVTGFGVAGLSAYGGVELTY